MTISPIAPISNATAFIQPALPPQLLAPAQAFAQVLETSISGPPLAPAALAEAGRTTGLLASSLEQVLFRDLLTSLQQADASVFSAGLQSVFTDEFGLTPQLSPGAVAGLLDSATPAQRAVLTAELTGLFSTIQLLGTDTTREPTLGGLLDVLA